MRENERMNEIVGQTKESRTGYKRCKKEQCNNKAELMPFIRNVYTKECNEIVFAHKRTNNDDDNSGDFDDDDDDADEAKKRSIQMAAL